MARTVQNPLLCLMEPVSPDAFSKSNICSFDFIGKTITKIPFNSEIALKITKAKFINCCLKKLPPGLEKYSLISTLDLSENLIEKLDPNTFSRFECLQHLILVSNHITNFKVELSSSLTYLDLSYNKGLVIEDIWSLNVPQLEVLKITHCAIKKLPENPPKTFSSTLISLFLDGNFLEEIPPYLGDFESLEEISLYGNRLRAIDFSCFKQNFKSVSFFYNDLDNFQSPEVLKTTSLNLNQNMFTEFPIKVLETQNLRILSLQNCKISGEIDFYFPETLAALDLSHNSITAIGERFTASLTKLSALNLAYNKISKIADAFPEKTALSNFYIGYNEIEKFPHSFSKLIHLDSFSAPHNKLRNIKQLNCLHLRSLDLSFNQLTELPDTFQKCTFLAELDISFNQLTTLPRSLSSCKKLRDFYATGNKFTVFPRCIFSFSQLKTLVVSMNQLSTIPTPLSSFFFLETLDLSCNHFTQLPSFISQFPSLRIFSMAHNLLTDLPEDFMIPPTLTNLDLSYNKLQSFHSLSESKKLLSLNLECNKLQTIDTSLFPNVKFLSLNNNPLKEPFPPFIVSVAQLHNLQTFEMLGCGKINSEVPPLRFHFISDSHVTLNPDFSIGYSATMGLRPSMEDSIAFHTYKNGSSLFSLFDGHQGNISATAAAFILHNEMQKINDIDNDESFRDHFSASFETVNKTLRRMVIKDGCTSIAAFFKGNKLFTAGVGDSRIVLVKKVTQERMTTDYKPLMRSEYERLTSEGLGISAEGRVSRKLAVSRTLGDFWCSLDSDCEDPLFVKPDIREVEITDDDVALILACDGLWDVIDDSVAADIVRNSKSPQDAANVLRCAALAMRSKDNISILVIFLHPEEKYKGLVYENEIEVMPPVVEEIEPDQDFDLAMIGVAQTRRRR